MYVWSALNMLRLSELFKQISARFFSNLVKFTLSDFQLVVKALFILTINYMSSLSHQP